MSHTKEPWSIDEYGRVKADGCNEFLGVQVDGFSLNGGQESKTNARRIVACVNACKNVDNETLEAIANGAMTGSEIHELAQVKVERDTYLDLCAELLNTLRIAESWLEGWASAESELEKTRGAINKAESILGESQ